MFDETATQKSGIITYDTHYPDTPRNLVYSGSLIGISNPLIKTARKECKINSDFDVVDLNTISDSYIQRCKYSISATQEELNAAIQTTQWDIKYNNDYRVLARTMVNLSGERSLMSAIIPPSSYHINGCFGIIFKHRIDAVDVQAMFSSIPFDYFIKTVQARICNLY